MGMPDFGSQVPKGCEGKIDFLFVIAAGGTMYNNQQQLISSFPGFMAEIEAQLPDFDVHIMSAGFSTWPLEDCKYCNGVDCDPQGAPPACGAELDYCDKHVPGAGITFPAGKGASNRRCAPYGGNRYIIDDEPDRTEAFTCVAQVGLEGGGRVAEAMVEAQSSAITGLVYTADAIVAVGWRDVGAGQRMTIWKLDKQSCEVIAGWPCPRPRSGSARFPGTAAAPST